VAVIDVDKNNVATAYFLIGKACIKLD